MSTLSDLARRMAEALAGSDQIQAWCQTNYTSSCKLFIGLDARRPPGVKDAPFIMVRAPKQDGGPEADSDNYTLMIDWGLNEPGTVTDEETDITEFIGHRQADALGELILGAAYEVSQNYMPALTEYEIEAESFFPLIAGGLTLVYSVPYVIGDPAEI